MKKKKTNIFIGLLLIFCILFVDIAPALAEFMDDDDITTRKERQLLKKIEVIHEAFPNQTDEAALYATLVHRGDFTDYVNDSYDPDWDESQFKEKWSGIRADSNSVYNNPLGVVDPTELIRLFLAAGFSAAECLVETVVGIFDTSEENTKTYTNSEGEEVGSFSLECVWTKMVEKFITEPYHNVEERVDAKYEEFQSIDLLTAAAIVMIDSSGWVGTYSDENYQKALAGSGLVGNLADTPVTKFLSSIFNGVFCTVGFMLDVATDGAGVDIATTGFNLSAPITNYAEFGSSAFLSSPSERLSRYYTMSRICESGFIGGTYTSVQDIRDEDIYQGKKDKIAEEIIGLAQQFRALGDNGGSADWCLTGNTQAGDFYSMTPEEFIAFLGPLAQADYSRTNIFASLTIAQAILESGWGKSELAQEYNNLFGITCIDNCIFLYDREWQVFASVEEGIYSHSELLMNETLYPGAVNATSAIEQLNMIADIYAPPDDGNENYAGKVTSLINEYDLTKWDVKTNTTSSIDVCAPVGLGGWNIRTVAPTASDSAFNYVSDNRGHCVWYAQGRAIEIVEELGSTGKLSEEEVNHIRELLLVPPGNGGEIYDNAVARGNFNTSNDIRQPKAGSYIVWKEPGNYGHVAVVEEVNTTDNTITITEGWSSSGNSCPNDWSCVTFNSVTMDLDEFYNSYGPNYNGGYQFSGYVYFLEPLS